MSVDDSRDVTQTSAAARPSTRADQRWVVFSSFDPAGRPSESAIAQVREYRDIGFNVLVVDTSDILDNSRRADWQREATHWFQRPNTGYDFGSFKAGLLYLMTHESLRAGGFDVVFANDSCFGPFVPLGPIIERFDRFALTEQRVFGMTDSVQYVHHIQSYWIYFRSNISHLALEFFLERMDHALSRNEAISMGELELGRFLLERGCTLEVVCSVSTTLTRLARFNGWFASTVELGVRRLLKRWKYNRDADNQCLRHLLNRHEEIRHNWMVLFGVPLYRMRQLPFVKKSMLRDNVHRDPAIPSGVDIYSMTNADVRSLLG